MQLKRKTHSSVICLQCIFLEDLQRSINTYQKAICHRQFTKTSIKDRTKATNKIYDRLTLSSNKPFDS